MGTHTGVPPQRRQVRFRRLAAEETSVRQRRVSESSSEVCFWLELSISKTRNSKKGDTFPRFGVPFTSVGPNGQWSPEEFGGTAGNESSLVYHGGSDFCVFHQQLAEGLRVSILSGEQRILLFSSCVEEGQHV